MSLGSHQKSIGKSQVYITPRWILQALGDFDLDPCAADPRPWSCARMNITEREDGLSRDWRGRVWLNPPFDRRRVGQWIARLARHGRGIALIHARTEAEWFEPIWQSAAAIHFLGNRITFHKPDGTQHAANSGAPAVLAAFGTEDAAKLASSGLPGFLCTRWNEIKWPHRIAAE